MGEGTNATSFFADFHLFDRFYGVEWTPELRAEAQRLLTLMRLEERTAIGDACFTRTALSTGQRKRLALILTHLDDRPIHVYDEWAADQDPEFRAFFYESLLPSLRERGRTVIAVSHDDRFFHLADRVIKLDRGQLSGHRKMVQGRDAGSWMGPIFGG